LITSNVWSLGRKTTTYDYGTTRVIDRTATNENYIMDFQFPISLLDASAFGGPTMTSSTIFMLTPVTGQSPSEPYKKDASYNGVYNVNNELPAPGSDPMTFDSTIIVPEVVVTGVSIASCPTPTLTATYLAPAKIVSGNTVANTLTTKDFYYWYDVDADGLADDVGSSWTFLANGTAPQLGSYVTASWNTSTLPQGQYIIKFYAIGQFGDTADSYNQTVTGFVQVKALFNNSCGTAVSPLLSATVTPSIVDASGNTTQRNVIYTITVTNESSVPVTLNSISDILPTGFTYVSNAGGTLTPSTSPTNGATGTITWTFPATSIPAGSSRTLSFNITAGTTVGTFSSNFSATGGTSYTPALNAAPVTVTRTSLSLALTASVAGALTPGQSFTYTLSYQNTGSLPQTNGVLVDTLPQGLNFVSASNGGTYNPANRTVTWSIGTIVAEGSGTRTIDVTVTSPYSGSTELSDYGRLYTTELPSGVASNVITHTVLNPDLSITHTPSPSTVTAGAQVTYTITYGNSGTSQATSVVIRDTIPSGQSYVSGSSSFTLTDSTGGILVWTIGTLVSGSENNVITYQTSTAVPYPTAGLNQSVPNTAYISSTQTPTESATATITVNANPNVSITTSSNQSVYFTTDTATITITLTNNGTANATLSSITDSLPSGFIYVSTGGGTLSPTSSPSNGATGQVTWSFSPNVTIAPGETKTLIFRARTTNTGSYTNTGKATGILVASTSSTISHSIVISVQSSSSSVTLTKIASSSNVHPGDTITYTIFYRNVSGGNQPQARIYDTIPSGVTYVTNSGTNVNGRAATFSFSTNVLQATLPNPYSNGDSTRYTFKVTVNAGTSGAVNNTASLYDGGAFIGSTNTTSSTSTTPPNITFSKLVDISSGSPGTTLTYTINYSNGSGAGTSTNTTILDTLPSTVTYVSGSASSGGAFNGSIGSSGRLSWNIGSLAANQSGSVSFQVTINTGVSNGTVITNNARLSNSEATPKTGTVTTTVAASPELDITLSVNQSSASPGDTLLYTINYANDGTANAASTVIRDTLPANTSFVSATGGGTFSSGVVTWNLGTVNFGTSGSVTFLARINAPIASGSISQISDSASISASGVQTVESNTVVTTLHYPSLALVISADSTFASPGTVYTYTIIVTNSSIVPAYNTTVFDTVPSNVTYVANSTTLNGAPVADVSGMTALRTGLSLGNLATGGVDTITYQVTVNSPLANGLIIPNTAYATTERITGKEASNTWNVTVRSTPIVSIVKAATLMGSGEPGDSILYTLTYGNSGNTAVHNVYLFDTIPLNSTYIEGSVTGTGASYELLDNRIVISRDSLGAGVVGQTATFKVLVASLLTSGSNTIQNTAALTSSDAAATTDTTQTTITASSTMAIEKAGPEFSTRSGSPLRDTITYTLTYSVSGNATNTNAVISDDLPIGLTYLSSTLNGAAAGSVAGQTVTWNIGTANPGTSGSATVTAYTSSNGSYDNSAALASTQIPGGTNSNTTTTLVSNPVTGVLTVLPSIDAGDPDTISVDDADLKGQGTMFVSIENPRTGELEIIGLTETGTNTGIFTGTVATLFLDSTTTDNDGYFLVIGDDSLNVTYEDELDATVNPRTTLETTLINSTTIPVTIVTPPDSSVTNDNTPTYTGTTNPNVTVIVLVDGTPIDTVISDGSGNWTTIQPTPLADGPHTVTANGTDSLGRTGTDTNPFTVDTTPPTVNVVTPTNGSTVTDNTPTYTGTTDPNTQVIVSVDGTPIDTVLSDGSGNWTTTQPTPLTDGPHSVTGTVSDALGNTATDTNNFNVDSTPPPIDVVTPAVGSTTNDNTPSITGTTDPNTTVYVLMDGVPIDTVVSDGSGNWSTVQPTPLSDGPHTVTGIAVDSVGNTATDANPFIVDTVPPTIFVDTPPENSTTNDNTPSYTGRTEPLLTVIVSVDGTPIDTVVADENGDWSTTQPTPLSNGSHSVTGTVTDPAGNTATDTNPFTVNTSAPSVDVVTPTNGSTISDNTPTISGTTNPNLTVIVSIDGVPLDTVVANGLGNWSAQVVTPLTDGLHTASALATDTLGQTATDANVFTIITSLPTVDVASPAEGSITNDNTPLYTGTTDPYLTVIISVDGTPIDTVVADVNGNWTTLQPTPLSNGSHAVTATAIDGLGQTATDTNNFTVNTSVPNVDVVTPANNSVITDNTPTINGTTDPNLTVIISVDGTPIDTVVADNLGRWTTVQLTPLADGQHTAQAKAIDDLGQFAIDANVFTVDTTPPAITITTPADGSTITDNTPPIYGVTEPYLPVIVKIDGVPIDTVTSDGAGNWTTNAPSPLPDGSHTVTADTRDDAGNTATDTNNFTIDTTPPSINVVTPTNGSTTSDDTPTYVGTTDPNQTVIVSVDGVPIDTVVADGSGNWTTIQPTPLSNGPHTVTGDVTDPYGNSATDTNNFIVAAIAPPVVDIVTPVNGSTVPDNTPNYTGTTLPNLTVIVKVDGTPIDTVIADGSGNWSTTQPTALSEGTHIVQATAIDSIGQTATDTHGFNVDTIAPSIVITTPPDGTTSTEPRPQICGTTESGSSVNVKIDGASIGTVVADTNGAWCITPGTPMSIGPHTITGTATDPSGNSSSDTTRYTVDTTPPSIVIITPANGDTTGPTPTITGITEPNITVIVYVDNVPIDTVESDGSGNWTTVSPALATGTHTAKGRGIDDAGNQAVSVTHTFYVDATPPPIVIQTPPDSSVTSDNTPTYTGTTDPNLTVIVKVDGVPIDTVVADGSGNWTTTQPTPLSDGPHTVSATATDPYGNSATDTNPFTVDTTPPTAVITEPTDGETTNDNTPPIMGTGTPGATLVLSVDGVPVDTLVIPANGQWSYTPPTPLADGPHTTQATVTDAVGNSYTTPVTDFIIDSTPPPVTVDEPINGTSTPDNTPQICGTTEGGDSVRVVIDNRTVLNTIADSSGNWCVTAPVLGDGGHTITVVAKDSAGNSTMLTGKTFTVNTKPVISSLGTTLRYLCDADSVLTVTGHNFNPTSVIRLNGTALTTTFVDSTTLTAPILASYFPIPGTYTATVYTPPPGGGTSGSKAITVSGSNTYISGMVYYDRNVSGTKETSEPGISAWSVSLTATNPSYNQTTTTEPGGTYTFTNLLPDDYTITVTPATGWDPTVPASATASRTVTCGSATTGVNFGFALSDAGSDTGSYRTFTPEALMEGKAIKKRCHLLRWYFSFTNNTGRQASGLYVEFNNVITTFYEYVPFAYYEDLGKRTQDYIFGGATIEDGETMQIVGLSKTFPCEIRVNKWWWLYNDSSISKAYSEGPLRADSIQRYLPMPNAANIRDEVFRSVFSQQGGMLVGAKVPNNSRNFAWVLMKTSKDLYNSLVDRTGTHTGRPRGFARDAAKTAVLRGALRSLPPKKHNNKLFADLAALRFNVAASTVGITPLGFGELIYDDGANPFSGLMVKTIAGRADTSMTFWQGKSQDYYIALDTAIRKLNQSFDGPIDTISWAVQLSLTGVKPLSAVSYLRPNPGAAVTQIAREANPDLNADVPESFSVYQNYPNPFNPTTTISFYLPAASATTIKIYDLLGKEVMTILDRQDLEYGEQSFTFDGANLPSGVYFFRISATVLPDEESEFSGQTFVETKKMMLIK
ncbi:MAG: DUF11 domain-containing protein, partial [Bacteroidetes bacterium]